MLNLNINDLISKHEEVNYIALVFADYIAIILTVHEQLYKIKK